MNNSLNLTNATTLPWRPGMDFPIKQRLSTKLVAFWLTIVIVGMLLNLICLVVIVRSKQLHYPRHMYWVAIALVNLFCLLQRIVKIVALLYQNTFVRQFHVLNASVGYSLLLLNLSLATLDRYLAVARSEWYKAKVTNRVVITAIVVTSLLTYTGITSPFWLGYKKISDFSINMAHMHWILVWDLILAIGCFIFQIKIFTKSQSLIRLYPHHLNRPPIVFQFTSGNQRLQSEPAPVEQRTPSKLLHPPTATENEVETQREHTTGRETAALFDLTDCFPWFRPQLNRLEIKAALNLSVNTIPLLICTFPITCNGIAIYWAIRLEMDCTVFVAISFYLDNLFLFHVIYNPLMYMLRSLEFRRTLKRFVVIPCSKNLTPTEH